MLITPRFATTTECTASVLLLTHAHVLCLRHKFPCAQLYQNLWSSQSSSFQCWKSGRLNQIFFSVYVLTYSFIK